jgi:hypothetical protein
MQVPTPALQHEVMIEAVENHNPEVIIIDEIGREREAAAARTINERGVQLIGTAHGNNLENLLINPTLSDLVGGIESVTLSDEEARRRGTQKTVLERRAPPTFDILIEIQDRQSLVIHRNVGMAVDFILRARALGVEHRYRDEEGQIVIDQEAEWKSTSPEFGSNRSSRGIQAAQTPQRFQSSPEGSSSQRRFEPAGVTLIDSQRKKTLKVFAYGVARNRLSQAANHLSVSINLVDKLSEADVLVTLKSHFRRQRKLILDAENRRTPIYVLRANTTIQMESFLAEAFDLETKSTDPFEQAITDTEAAIQNVQSGKTSFDLKPVGSAIRRYQHQMARQANLVSHSYGKGRNRHVRIFNTPLN